MTGRAKLTALRGLPASGKSTWAKAYVAEDPQRRFRVCRDDLRAMGHKSVHVKPVKGRPGSGTERIIVTARNAMILELLQDGISVVVDETNLTDKKVRELHRIAALAGAEFEIRWFDTPYDVCVQRNAERTGVARVPDEAMERMLAEWGGRDLSVMPAAADATLDEVLLYQLPQLLDPAPAVFLVDIDGTVALHGDRSPYDMTRVGEDTPNPVVIEVLEGLDYAGYRFVFMSGRDESCREDTEAWLKRHVQTKPLGLFMRAVGDNRPDAVVKAELFNRHVRNGPYRVFGVFDDRRQVVRMWRSMGLTVFQVADGMF